MEDKEYTPNSTVLEIGTILLEKLHQRTLIVKDTGISNRVIRNWQQEGLIDEFRGDKAQWRKFSLIEVLWISIIGELRNIGFNIPLLKKVKEQLFLLSGKDFPVQHKLSVFEQHIIEVIVFYEPAFLLIDKDGQVNIYSDETYFESLKKGDLHFHQVISLNQLVKDTFPELFSMPKFKEFPSLSPKEVELISIVRSNNYQSIKIKKKNGELDMIEGVERIDVERKLIDLLNDGDYQNIELRQENGKIVNVSRTIKRKL